MNGRYILVVDDDPDILQLICDLLEMEDFEAVCLTDPREITTLPPDRGTPHFILLDLMLLGTTGIEVARDLRADGYPTTPMVAMSASSVMLGDAVASNLFDATLSKPFELSHLLDLADRYTA